MTYTIKQFAKLFQTTEHTIRYYTDIALLPCQRDEGNRRIFDEDSVRWMQGISCLRRCGASIEAIREYFRLCQMEQTGENLKARYEIILGQCEQAHKRAAEANATAAYMDQKVKHYEAILAGSIPDDTNPGNWTHDAQKRP